MELTMHIVIMICAIFSCIVPLICITRALAERQSKALILFILVLMCAFLTSMGALLVLTSRGESALMPAVKIEYAGRIFCLALMPLFIAEYLRVRLSKGVRWALVITCFICMMFVLQGTTTNLFFSNVRMEMRYQIALLHCEYGIIYQILWWETLFVFVVLISFMIRKIIQTQAGSRAKYILLLGGCLFTVAGVSLTDTALTDGVDLIPFSMACSCIIFDINLRKYHMFDMMQTAKETVVDTMEECLAVLDSDKKVIYRNGSFDKYCQSLIDCESLSEAVLNKKDGEEIDVEEKHFRVYQTEICRDNDSVQGFLYELHDTTETRQKMKEIERLTFEARSANQAKSQFLASMSHEIRTPINAILGMNEMILRENTNEVITEYASNIDVAGRALLTLINDILDYSKIDYNHIDWVNVRYKLSELLQEIELKIFPRLEEKDIVFEINLDENLPSELFGDESRVKQVLLNLLTNAVKYTDKGRIVLTVTASEIQRNPGEFPGAPEGIQSIYLTFKVEDTGQGIKEENLEQIFESFKRVEEGKNRNIEGTGLGLALTKRILDCMLGTITAESEYGKGSTFTASLPQAIYDPTPIKAMKLVYTSKNKNHIQKRFTIPDAHILIVDDNAVNLKVINNLLKRTKAQIENAKSGEECLEITKKKAFHLILMDHLMPGMDGVETFQTWKKMDERVSKDIPVIILTANTTSGSREQYLAYGFSDYLEKPVDIRELERALMKYLPMEMIIMQEETEA